MCRTNLCELVKTGPLIIICFSILCIVMYGAIKNYVVQIYVTGIIHLNKISCIKLLLYVWHVYTCKKIVLLYYYVSAKEYWMQHAVPNYLFLSQLPLSGHI